MLKNYLKIALRNLTKHRSHSLINIIGLGVAIACSILLLLFIQHELSYDSFHQNGDKIFRINYSSIHDDGTQISSKTQAPLAPAIKQEFPEVEYAARFLFSDFSVKYKDNIYSERITFTDADFLKMFSFELLAGNPDQVLSDKNTIVLSKQTAEKYFYKENPIGKQLTFIRSGESYIFTVVGIIEEVAALARRRSLWGKSSKR